MFYTLQAVKDSELQLQEQFWRLVKPFLFTGHMSVIFQTPIDIQILQSGLHTTGKNNGFPVLDILGYLKNTHKNPKFGKVTDKS